MTPSTLLLTVVFAPILGSFALLGAGRVSQALRNYLSLALVMVSLAGACLLSFVVFSSQPAAFNLPLPMGFNLFLNADGLSVFMALVSSLISAIIIMYSFGYISHYSNQDEYYFLVTLFLGSMMGLVFSANLIWIYLFWELTAVTSWRLIGFARRKEETRRADKAFLMTVTGALFMLAGFIIIAIQAGSFDLPVIKQTLRGQPLNPVAVILILMGILSKSATLPFHVWLPDAGVAPSPVTALLHAAVLVKIGVYVFARLFIVTAPLESYLNTFVIAIAGISALISGGAALVETDLKRIIAYSTISQIAFIFLGLGCGTKTGLAGAMLFIFTHGLAKAGLFLSAGIIEHNAGTKDINKLGGLIKTMPWTAVAFLICAFSVMGLPPLAGFFSKYLVFNAAVSSGRMLAAFVFFIGAIFTVLYLMRVFNMVFLGDIKTAAPREGSKIMVFCVVLLAFLSLAAGIFINYPAYGVNSAVEAVFKGI